MKMCPNPVTAKFLDHTVTVTFREIPDRPGDLMEVVVGFRKTDSLKETLPGHIDETLCVVTDFSDAPCSGCIGMIPLPDESRIERDDIPSFRILFLLGMP